MNPETLIITAGILSVISISTAQIIIKLKRLTKKIDKVQSLCDVFTRYDKHFVNMYEEININNNEVKNHIITSSARMSELAKDIQINIEAIKTTISENKIINNPIPKKRGWPKGKKRKETSSDTYKETS